MSRKKILGLLIAGLVLAAGIVVGVRKLVFALHHVSTDDAQLEGDIEPIIPRVSGYVAEVDVKDNERVQAGQRLLRIDDRDLRSRLAMAEGAVAAARSQVAVAQAKARAAEAAREKTATDQQRLEPLRRKEEVSRQLFDAAVAAARSAEAELEAAASQVSAASAQVVQKEADAEYARLQLSYAVVPAPISGFVAKKSVEPGELVQSGQPLMAIAADTRPWVVANFKETQLRRIRVGQPVAVEIDAYPGFRVEGRVESFSAATGAKFALLPPDNATGNFTKVVQRVPVKIVLSSPPDERHPLRVGMSVTATVRVD